MGIEIKLAEAIQHNIPNSLSVYTINGVSAKEILQGKTTPDREEKKEKDNLGAASPGIIKAKK